MKPEDIIGPASVAALEKAGYKLVPPTEPAPVVTWEDAKSFALEYYRGEPWPKHPNEALDMWAEDCADGSDWLYQSALSAFVLRWLRARLEGLPESETCPGFGTVPDRVPTQVPWICDRAAYFRALTGRPW